MSSTKIVLLSGGSGTRLWPLSNGVRSKQFLKLLKSPDGKYESMFQRVIRQIKKSGLDVEIFVSTSISQVDSIINQSGLDKNIIVEPERRDTFPAIALAVAYLLKEAKCSSDDVVIVMPVDPYTDDNYFETLKKVAKTASEGVSNLVLMGIKPTSPSSKFGYIIPEGTSLNDVGAIRVDRMVEKPSESKAKEMIASGAFWNAGVFAFKLSYIENILKQYTSAQTYEGVRADYSEFTKTSFDYAVVEKEQSISVVPFDGDWHDLGTWNTIGEKLPYNIYGNAMLKESKNSNVVNELDIPILCVGLENTIVAASQDGILVCDKSKSELLKNYVHEGDNRPMYEERRWGTYKVMGVGKYSNNMKSLTKQLHLKDGCHISYQRHKFRDEIWTVVEGEGILILDGKCTRVTQGDVVVIKAGQMHAIKSLNSLQIIEVQLGTVLIEGDIERFDFNWNNLTIN